jgi:glucan 1,3-beta-glucosidase
MLVSCTGSQNGYDNSGQRTSDPTWAQNATNVALTLDIIRFIIKNIGGMIDVMELLNEPAGFMGDDFIQVLRQFWQDGYDQVRAIARPDLRIMIGDAFIGVNVSLHFHHWFLS